MILMSTTTQKRRPRRSSVGAVFLGHTLAQTQIRPLLPRSSRKKLDRQIQMLPARPGIYPK